MMLLIMDMDFLYLFNLRLIAPLFTVSFHEMFGKKNVFWNFKSWQVCDWLAKWIIMLWLTDLRWPRVFWYSNLGLVLLAVSSPNTINSFMSHNNQLPVVKQYFTNIAPIQRSMVVLQQIWLTEIIGRMLLMWMCQNITMQYMDHGLKLILFYVQKHIIAMGMCYNPALVRDKPLRAPASVKLVYEVWCHPSL